ncbi:MAG TPA: DUF1257 domain-containing protein [Kofleriaceae bacterium]|nr:DUF1257 domain-containing protein [Kofleriaceae bacterium]
MSHFTKCDLKMKNLEAIKRALEDLGYPYQAADGTAGVNVRGWRGQTTAAEIAIDMGTYDIGVVRADDGTYDIVADWWGIETTKGVTEDELKDRLSQRYSYHQVVMACTDKGYSVEEEENEEDGSVRLVVRKWVAD